MSILLCLTQCLRGNRLFAYSTQDKKEIISNRLSFGCGLQNYKNISRKLEYSEKVKRIKDCLCKMIQK